MTVISCVHFIRARVLGVGRGGLAGKDIWKCLTLRDKSLYLRKGQSQDVSLISEVVGLNLYLPVEHPAEN